MNKYNSNIDHQKPTNLTMMGGTSKIGKMIRGIMHGMSADKTDHSNSSSKLTSKNIKSMNLRNGRFKVHESLIGSMMNSHAPSQTRSAFEPDKSPMKLFKNTNAFVKLNFLSWQTYWI